MKRFCWLCVLFLLFVNSDALFLDGNNGNQGNNAKCPSNISRNYLFTYKDTCIQFIQSEKTWTDARKNCIQQGGDLVVIQDKDKQNFIVNAIKYYKWSHHGIWIGGSDADREGLWKWVNGEKITWENWERGQGPTNRGFLHPSGIFEDCALLKINDGYRWHDYLCSSKLFEYTSICEYNFLDSTTPPYSTPILTSTPGTATAIPTSTMKLTSRTTMNTGTKASTTIPMNETKALTIPTSVPTTGTSQIIDNKPTTTKSTFSVNQTTDRAASGNINDATTTLLTRKTYGISSTNNISLPTTEIPLQPIANSTHTKRSSTLFFTTKTSSRFTTNTKTRTTESKITETTMNTTATFKTKTTQKKSTTVTTKSTVQPTISTSTILPYNSNVSTETVTSTTFKASRSTLKTSTKQNMKTSTKTIPTITSESETIKNFTTNDTPTTETNLKTTASPKTVSTILVSTPTTNTFVTFNIPTTKLSNVTHITESTMPTTKIETTSKVVSVNTIPTTKSSSVTKSTSTYRPTVQPKSSSTQHVHSTSHRTVSSNSSKFTKKSEKKTTMLKIKTTHRTLPSASSNKQTDRPQIMTSKGYTQEKQNHRHPSSSNSITLSTKTTATMKNTPQKIGAEKTNLKTEKEEKETVYIIAGICAAIGVVVLLLLFTLVRRRRKAKASKKVLFADNPLYCSSVVYDDKSIPNNIGCDVTTDGHAIVGGELGTTELIFGDFQEPTYKYQFNEEDY